MLIINFFRENFTFKKFLMADLKNECKATPGKKECIWKYVPQDNRSITQCLIDFLESTSGREKV